MTEPATPSGDARAADGTEAVSEPAESAQSPWVASVGAGLAVLLLLVMVTALGVALSWPRQARQLPALILLAALPVAILVCVREVRTLLATLRPRRAAIAEPSAVPTEESAGESDSVRAELQPLVWLAVFTVLIFTLGALLGMGAFALLFLRVRGERWKLSVAYSVIMPLALYAVFTGLLGINVYAGLLGRL